MDGAGIEWARRRVGASRIKSLNELFSFSSLAQTCGELRMDEAFFLFWPIAAKDDAKKEGKFNFRPAKSIFVVCRSHDDAGPDDSIQSATAIKRKWRDFFLDILREGGLFSFCGRSIRAVTFQLNAHWTHFLAGLRCEPVSKVSPGEM